MNKSLKKTYRIYCCFILFALLFSGLHAQNITISGTVYDLSARNPIEAVTVMSTSGKGTITDSLGRYRITVKKTDSIYFSLLNKATMKYVVDTISNPLAFDVSIHIRVQELPEVKVRNSNYRLDSLQNRREYAKYFDFKKPGIKLNSNQAYNPSGGVTVGLDLEEFINMFRFKRNRNLQFLQDRLIQQEQDRYINYRFNKLLVKKLTKLTSPDLDTFMVRYRPTYDLLVPLNDIELGHYIQQLYKIYKSQRFRGAARKPD